ncbi:CoA-transferase [Hyphomonas sp. FCG-A18]|uniref:CoA transferase subunit A n=1 Tax=Hyphomonas sp. FCG-A18 TaxID=3080019 RepID=UPI002B318AFD|nr:CoA-transferase [Hyphomonas sp. FCG-A18]
MRRSRVIDEEAALDFIRDGMTISIGGHLNSAHPMLLIRGIIRRGLKDLTIITSAQGGPEIGFLIAAGCVKKLITSGVHAEGMAGIDPCFRFALQRGDIEIWEADEGIVYAMLRAAAQGLPFLPWHGGVGTSIPEVNPFLKEFDDPISGKPLLAVPAIAPDLAILHAATSDMYGNVQHVHGWGDRAHYRAAKETIVQVEKVISNEDVRRDPSKTSIIGADAIVRAPFGAHPMASPEYYLEDQPFIKTYVSCANAAYKKDDMSELTAFIDEYFVQPQDHFEYLEKIGVSRLFSLHEF